MQRCIYNRLDIEDNFDTDLINELKSKGHQINYPVPPIGGGQMILIDEEKSILIGASDWRKDGLAIGYWLYFFLISLYVIKRQEAITTNPPIIWL